MSKEIADVRGVPANKDCVSPPGHTEFKDADGLLDFVEMLAAETGLPVGIKSAVGEQRFWDDLTKLMARGDRGVDFVTIDGGEGGTGAAPLVSTDHVEILDERFGGTSVREMFGYEEGWGAAEEGDVEGLLEELGEGAGEEEQEEAAAHGVTPFPEIAG